MSSRGEDSFELDATSSAHDEAGSMEEGSIKEEAGNEAGNWFVYVED